MKLERRLEIEKIIREKLVDELLADGYELAIHDGEECTECGTDGDKAKKTLGACDEEWIFTRKGGKKATVFLVYGNSGYDVICDYSIVLQKVIDKLDPMIDEFEREACS